MGVSSQIKSNTTTDQLQRGRNYYLIYLIIYAVIYMFVYISINKIVKVEDMYSLMHGLVFL